MRKHYNILVFDGSYFLYRNQCIGKTKFGPNELATSLIQTIVKLVRESGITFDVGFLAFDKKPYHRTKLLGGRYKDNRSEFTSKDIALIEGKLRSSNLNEDERLRLESEKSRMESALTQLKIRIQAQELLLNLRYFGVTVLRYPGWEADDLARLVVDLYGSSNSILLLSIDSDWTGMVSDNVDYLRVRHKGKDFYNVDSVKSTPYYQEMVDYGIEDMGLEFYLQVLESMGVGHNNMRKCWDDSFPITISEIMANWDDLEVLKDDFNFDINTFKSQLNTFDIKEFPDYVKVRNSIKSLNYELKTLDDFESLFLYRGIIINKYYYKSLYERIHNYSLLQL
jgi:hypothetical protein